MPNTLFSSRHFAALAAAGALLTSSPTFAESPMNTDDAGTLAGGGTKLEALWSRDDRARGGEMQFGFAPVEHLEIGIAFARAHDRSTDPATRQRANGLAIKWVPVQNDSGWSLGMSFSHGRTRIDERTTAGRHSEREYAINGLASHRFADGQVVHLNLGQTRLRSRDGSADLGTWNVGYEFPLQDDLQLTAETFGLEHGRPDKALGLRHELFAGCKLSAAIGHGNGRRFAQAGLAWEF